MMLDSHVIMMLGQQCYNEDGTAMLSRGWDSNVIMRMGQQCYHEDGTAMLS